MTERYRARYMRFTSLERALREVADTLRGDPTHAPLAARCDDVLRRVPLDVSSEPPVPRGACGLCGRYRRPRRAERLAHCAHAPCSAPFYTRSPRARYCSPSHRSAAHAARKIGAK